MLDNINIYLNKIIDHNYNGDPYQTEKWFLYISSELMRLFPLRRNKKTEQLELSPTDGILLLDKNIPFILEKYNKICSIYVIWKYWMILQKLEINLFMSHTIFIFFHQWVRILHVS